jgi:Na+/H+ antiporter NhaD/arsenite permease-like protein
LIYFSLLGPQVARQRNQFNLHAIQEVAALFIGIFLTMIPALMFLRQIAPTLPLNEVTFFLFTGGLSSVLDNAPTYLTFFEMAQSMGGSPAVAGVFEPYLVSISLGAVFCGAMTYIGNGPNFMVKAIAEQRGIVMPSFVGYLKWSVSILVPVFFSIVTIFITQASWLVSGIGVLLLQMLVFFIISRKK